MSLPLKEAEKVFDSVAISSLSGWKLEHFKENNKDLYNVIMICMMQASKNYK